MQAKIGQAKMGQAGTGQAKTAARPAIPLPGRYRGIGPAAIAAALLYARRRPAK